MRPLALVAIYDAPAGGVPLWTEEHVDADITDGYFSLSLGAIEPLDSGIFSGAPLYLGLRVNGAPELPQRLALVSVPYAVRAQDADHASVATSVSGGVVNATELRVDGQLVADASGLQVLPTAHSHDAVDVVSGVLAPARIPTHAHDAQDLTTGTVAMVRLPVGTSADTVARGDHTHTAADVGALAVGTLATDIGGLASTTTAADIGALPVGTKATDIGGLASTTTAADIGALPVGTKATDIGGLASTTTAADIGALPVGTTAADIGALPVGTTAADIGALPVGTKAADIGGLASTTTAADIGGLMATGGTLSGALTIQGTVTVGNSSGSTCTTTNEGELRWNGTDFEGCTGTDWIILGRRPIGVNASNPGLSCKDILAACSSQGDGVYWIDPNGGGAFEAYCDMTTNGGGWTQVMNVAPTDGNSVGYNNQAFWTTDAPYGSFANRFTNDYKSAAAYRLSGGELLIESTNTSGAILGWRRWPMTVPRTFDSFFTTGIVPVHATDVCETPAADAVSVGSTSTWDDIIRQGSCLYADINPSASGHGDTIRLSTTAHNSTDNQMSGFASCIDCGTPWQGTTSPYMGLDRAGCNTTACAYSNICRMPAADCAGGYCTSTYSTTSCGSTWNSRFFVR